MGLQPSANVFEPREAVRILLRRKWLLIIPIILVSAIVFGGSYLIAPQYESAVVIWIGNPVKLTRDLQRMIGQFQDIVLPQRNVRQDIRAYSHQIASRQYASLVMDKMNFTDDEETRAQVERIAVLEPDMTPRDLNIAFVRGRLASDLKLEFITNSHLRISAKSQDPYEARDLAQSVGEVFVKEQATEELRSIFLSLDFSSDLLARYEKKLQDKTDEKILLGQEIAKWQSDNALTAEANRSDLSSEIERRNQEIVDLSDEEASILASMDRLGQEDFKLDESRMVRRTKQQIVNMIASLEALVQEHVWRDPTIDNLSLRVVQLGDDLEDEHKRLVRKQYADFDDATQAEISRLFYTRHRRDMLHQFVVALHAGLTALDSKRSSIPEYQAKLDRLDREVKAAETLRDQFKVQLEGFEISQELVEETRFRIVEEARPQLTPVWPDRRMIIGIGLVVGMIIGGAGIFVVEYSDRSLKDAETTEEILGINVVGVVPKIEDLA